MASSYDTVAGLLMKLPDFTEYEQRTLDRLERVRFLRFDLEISDHEYNMGRAKEPEVVAFFKLEVDGEELPNRTQCTDYAIDNWTMIWEMVALEVPLNDIVRSNFGTPACRTYNCKLDKMVDKFPACVRRELSRKYDSSHLRPAAARVREEMRDAMRELLPSAREEFRNRQAIEGIKKAIRKFPVTKDVLKQALDEYIVHEILEC